MTQSSDAIGPTRTARAPLLARLPTGAKLFLILSAALLPLALIAVFAALQTTRTADLENRAQLRVAAAEAARTLGIELVGDINALRSALAILEVDPGDAPSCARTRGVFAHVTAGGGRFSVVDAEGQLRCGSSIPEAAALAAVEGAVAAKLDGDGLLLVVTGGGGAGRASAFFPREFLARLARANSYPRDHGTALRGGGVVLTLEPLDLRPLARRDRLVMPTGIGNLDFEMTAASAPITSPVMVAMLLPVLMWAAAAGIGWFVVDRLLIRPLRRLRRQVGAYTPGTIFDPGTEPIPAQELRELGDTFGTLSRTIVAHEADVAEGLVRQTRLTREVHHRVKNNLQVIASLINFHSRSAAGDEAIAAYATIQRRVDALAVVHRHHFAELEVNRGLALRPVIGELAANLRATAPASARDFVITIDVEPVLVSQDSAVAVTFLLTELIELAMAIDQATGLRIAVVTVDDPHQARWRVSSPALIYSETARTLIAERYGRVVEGLARQLRSRLQYEPLVGVFEIVIPILGRD